MRRVDVSVTGLRALQNLELTSFERSSRREMVIGHQGGSLKLQRRQVLWTSRALSIERIGHGRQQRLKCSYELEGAQ